MIAKAVPRSHGEHRRRLCSNVPTSQGRCAGGTARMGQQVGRCLLRDDASPGTGEMLVSLDHKKCLSEVKAVSFSSAEPWRSELTPVLTWA